MTKKEFAAKVAQDLGFPSAEAQTVVESVFKVLGQTVADGENLYIRGFGAFTTITRAAKVARHIKNGTQMNLPAKKVVKFVPYPELSNAVGQ